MEYRFIGHCHDAKENHDKVWGVIYLEDAASSYEPGFGNLASRKVLTFWGRRGKKLQTKLAQDNWDLVKLIDSKRRKEYTEIRKDRLDEVYPEFQADLEKTAMWALLKF
jgi:hypothetical protein